MNDITFTDLKARLEFERIKSEPAVASLILSLAGRLMAQKRSGDNMRRSGETYQKANQVRWLHHVKVKTDKQKREERTEL